MVQLGKQAQAGQGLWLVVSSRSVAELEPEPGFPALPSTPPCASAPPRIFLALPNHRAPEPLGQPSPHASG